MRVWLATIIFVVVPMTDRSSQTRPRGVRLETHTWVEAQALLHPDAVVVIPLGAALKEHGPI